MPTTHPDRTKGELFPFLAAALAAGGLILATCALVLWVTADDAPGPKVISAQAAASSGPHVELGEMYIKGDLTIAAGTMLTVVNAGATSHNLTVEGGPHTPDLNGGKATVLDTSTLTPGTYIVYCSIEGHRAAGMEAKLKVGPAHAP